MTNAELAAKIDTTDEWIAQRSGIRERRIVGEGEKTSDLAIAAVQAALGQAGMSGSDLDLIVLATTAPDQTFPATAVRVQAALGMTRGAFQDRPLAGLRDRERPEDDVRHDGAGELRAPNGLHPSLTPLSPISAPLLDEIRNRII